MQCLLDPDSPRGDVASVGVGGNVSSRQAHVGKKPTALDLFSGAGGFSLGLASAGFDIVGAVDCWDIAEIGRAHV